MSVCPTWVLPDYSCLVIIAALTTLFIGPQVVIFYWQHDADNDDAASSLQNGPHFSPRTKSLFSLLKKELKSHDELAVISILLIHIHFKRRTSSTQGKSVQADHDTELGSLVQLGLVGAGTSPSSGPGRPGPTRPGQPGPNRVDEAQKSSFVA